jgi:hypothetical protein
MAIAGAVAATAAVGYVAAWFYGASRFEREIADGLNELEGDGLTVAHGEIRVDGFPFALIAWVPDLVLKNEVEGTSIDVAPIWLRTTLWNRRRINYDFAGRHVVVTDDGENIAQITVTMDTGKGVFLLNEDHHWNRLTITKLRLFDENRILSIAGLETSDRIASKPFDAAGETVQSIYTVTGLTISNRLGVNMIDPQVDRVRLEVSATGPFMEIFEDSSVVEWAEGSGVVTLRDLTLEWGGLTLTATGSGGFDSELRPEGALTLASTAFEEKLGELERSGTIAPYVVELIRYWTAPFILPPRDGNPSELIVPISAKDGLLSLGDEPLGAVPSLKTL